MGQNRQKGRGDEPQQPPIPPGSSMSSNGCTPSGPSTETKNLRPPRCADLRWPQNLEGSPSCTQFGPQDTKGSPPPLRTSPFYAGRKQYRNRRCQDDPELSALPSAHRSRMASFWHRPTG